MTELRKLAHEAWREAGKATVKRLGFRSKGVRWRAVDELERFVLLEAGPWNSQNSATFSVRAHVGHPALSPLAARGRIWSVFCYPAHLLDESHSLALPEDSERLLHQMTRHLQAAVDDFLFRWDTPHDVLDYLLADPALEPDEPPRLRSMAEVITPGSDSVSAIEAAAVWATVERQPEVVQEARLRLGNRPERWYGKRERHRSEKEIEEALRRLHQE